MFQSSVNGGIAGGSQIYPAIGYSFGGMVGYDFVGPRIAIEGLYNNSKATVSGGGLVPAFGATKDEIAAMANIYYDFNAGGTIVPYIGAGAGIAFEKISALNLSGQQHGLRVSGHRRYRLQYRSDLAREPWKAAISARPARPSRVGASRTTTSSRCCSFR